MFDFRWNALCLLLAAGLAVADPVAGEQWIESETGMRFAWVPPGCFSMGTADGYGFERPVHKVCVKGFWIGIHEVTQAQYQKLAGRNPSNHAGANLPVESITWTDSMKLAQKLAQSSGQKIRLPSEAEWEYACRAGGRHDTYCGDGKLDKLAWYMRNSDGQTWPVGGKLPNAWGLYDMNGNVWEWVQDCWHEQYYGAPDDGSAWNQGGDCTNHVARGGSWGTVGSSTRAAVRDSDVSMIDFTDVGVRLVREP